MFFNSPLPRASQVRVFEGSSLRSTRDAARPDRLWHSVGPLGLMVEILQRAVAKQGQDLNRLRRRVLGGGGATATPGMDFGNEYDPSVSYKAKTMVIFTPDGGAAGTYVSLSDVKGIAPDTGKPNWVALPNSPPGMWG